MNKHIDNKTLLIGLIIYQKSTNLIILAQGMATRPILFTFQKLPEPSRAAGSTN